LKEEDGSGGKKQGPDEEQGALLPYSFFKKRKEKEGKRGPVTGLKQEIRKGDICGKWRGFPTRGGKNKVLRFFHKGKKRVASNSTPKQQQKSRGLWEREGRRVSSGG